MAESPRAVGKGSEEGGEHSLQSWLCGTAERTHTGVGPGWSVSEIIESLQVISVQPSGWVLQYAHTKYPCSRFHDFKNPQQTLPWNVKKHIKFWNHEQRNVLKYKLSNPEKSICCYDKELVTTPLHIRIQKVLISNMQVVREMGSEACSAALVPIPD